MLADHGGGGKKRKALSPDVRKGGKTIGGKKKSAVRSSQGAAQLSYSTTTD